MAAYRKLVYETPGFTDYFFSATPIREIAELNIGSRPASRKPTQKIEDLRAIPWGFSWGQCRLTLPGWYGFGSAVQSFHAKGQDPAKQQALLRRMYKQWPFFRTLLSNMDMVLAKSDLALASRYSELVPDAAAQAHLRVHRGRMAPHGRGAGNDHRREAAPGTQQRWRAPSATASPTSTRCTTCRWSWCAAGAMGRATSG
jgi:phosphoenolpyruvate carboxylase